MFVYHNVHQNLPHNVHSYVSNINFSLWVTKKSKFSWTLKTFLLIFIRSWRPTPGKNAASTPVRQFKKCTYITTSTWNSIFPNPFILELPYLSKLNSRITFSISFSFLPVTYYCLSYHILFGTLWITFHLIYYKAPLHHLKTGSRGDLVRSHLCISAPKSATPIGCVW